MGSKRSFQLVLVFIIIFLAWINSYAADEYFDKSDTEKGVLHITYKGNAGKKAKVMIQKDNKKYTYDINTQGKVESFPLQLGNGSYKVMLLENISGSSYNMIASETMSITVEDSKSIFLNSIQNINWTIDSKAVKKAVELTNTAKNLDEKAKLLYNHMAHNYTYDYNKLAKLPSTYLPVIDMTLAEKKGICYDFSSLYGAMLRSQGIPAKLVKGYTPNAEGYHAWNEVYDDSKKEWLIIDTTYDLQVIKSKPKVRMVKSERDYQKVNEY